MRIASSILYCRHRFVRSTRIAIFSAGTSGNWLRSLRWKKYTVNDDRVKYPLPARSMHSLGENNRDQDRLPRPSLLPPAAIAIGVAQLCLLLSVHYTNIPMLLVINLCSLFAAYSECLGVWFKVRQNFC